MQVTVWIINQDVFLFSTYDVNKRYAHLVSYFSAVENFHTMHAVLLKRLVKNKIEKRNGKSRVHVTMFGLHIQRFL